MEYTSKILIGIPVKNTGQFLPNLFNQLRNLDYNKRLITISLVEGDSNDNSYDICKTIQYTENEFENVHLDKMDFGFQLNHNDDRWKIENFKSRIRNLVSTRNFIINNYSHRVDYVWWVDSDFEIIPPNTLKLLLDCNKDVIIPMLTHDRFGFHDCGSVTIADGVQKRFQFDTTNELIKLDRADCHCFINGKVFKTPIRYTYVESPYRDGCGHTYPCYSDGTQFSFDCIRAGYQIYGAKHIIIKHHNV